MGLNNYKGTLQDYKNSFNQQKLKFDIISICWTLENTHDCQEILNICWDMLKENGKVVIATGSRILMPFKKPLHFYVGPGKQDSHCFRFSDNSLSNLLFKTGFKPIYTNRFIDNDILCIIGEKEENKKDFDLQKDNYKKVVDFFNRWAKDSSSYYSDWKNK